MNWSQPTEAVTLAAATLDVWAVRIDWQGAPCEGLSASLSEVERQRASQFRLDEPRQRFIVTRAALRALLGNYLGLPPRSVEIETETAGRPCLAGPQRASGVHFSISHSGALALIAVTLGCEVGVDVERVRPIRHAEHIARRFLHPAEKRAIVATESPARDRLFLRCWTAKEAVLKAIGSGITGSLASFSVPTGEFATASIELPAPLYGSHSRCWLQALAPCQEYVGTVACLGGTQRVRPFLFDA